MPAASDNEFPKLILVEGAAPATPSSGLVKLYAKSDGLLYSKDDAGAETALGVSGGGAGDMLAANNLSDVADAPTSRTNLGVGTGDTPQLAGVNVGHASDTTVTRASAGDIAVEGNIVHRAGGTDVAVADGGTGASTAAGARTNLGLGTGSLLVTDTDTALAANSDSNVATQKAVKAYVDSAVTGLLDFKGATDCSANPNYPAALKGDSYVVSVAGKIGGTSGTTVEVGDVYVASADNAGGTQAGVGTSWFLIEHNLQGAVLTGGALGTPSSGTLTSCTGLPLSTGVTGTLQAAQEPAHTGDVTNSAGSLAMTIANGAVTLAKQASIATLSFLGRLTASAGVQEVLTALQAWGILMGQTAALTAPAIGLLATFGGAGSAGTTNNLRHNTATAGMTICTVPQGWKMLIYAISMHVASAHPAGQTGTAKVYVETADQSSNFATCQTTDAITYQSAETSTPGTPYVIDATSAEQRLEVKILESATAGSKTYTVDVWGVLIRP